MNYRFIDISRLVWKHRALALEMLTGFTNSLIDEQKKRFFLSRTTG
jgi:hypothetical protein